MTGINTLPGIILVTTVLLGSSTSKSAESGNTAFAFKLFAVLKVLLNYMNGYIKKRADSSNSLFIVCFKKKKPNRQILQITYPKPLKTNCIPLRSCLY